MAKMFFSTQNCKGVTSGATGRSYDTDSRGYIHVDDSRDVKALQAGGYVLAGTHMATVKTFFRCESCAWDAVINHCPKCDSDDLTLIEK